MSELPDTLTFRFTFMLGQHQIEREYEVPVEDLLEADCMQSELDELAESYMLDETEAIWSPVDQDAYYALEDAHEEQHYS